MICARAASKAKIVVADKKFSLAGKLFDYVFESAVSANPQFFCAVGFHVFAANLLYIAWLARPESAGMLLRAFQHSMRTLDREHLKSLSTLFAGSDVADSPQDLVLRSALANMATMIYVATFRQPF